MFVVMLVGVHCTFFKVFFFNKWSPNSYLFWMMEGFYIQKKMGDTKKQIIFEKCHHWWGGFQDDEKVKTLLAEQHLNLSDLQRGISRNFLDETQESPPSFIQFKKKIHTNFYLCLLAAVGFIIDIGLSQTERSRTQIHVIFGFCTVNLYTCFPEYKLVGIHWIL